MLFNTVVKQYKYTYEYPKVYGWSQNYFRTPKFALPRLKVACIQVIDTT